MPFGIVGALVPELLLDARPARMTNDADVMAVVQTLAEFDALKDQLARIVSSARASRPGRGHRYYRLPAIMLSCGMIA